MSRSGMFVLCIGLVASCALGQIVEPSSPNPAQSELQPERVKVYFVGRGVTAPELLPLNLPSFTTEKCEGKIDGKVKLSILVDAAGHARNAMFLHPLGTDADRFAIKLAVADQFKPGTVDGKPVVTAQSLEIEIQSCRVVTKDTAGKLNYSLKLTAEPKQRLEPLPHPPDNAVLAPDEDPATGPRTSKNVYSVGGSVSVPVPLFQPQAEITDEARKNNVNGDCAFSLVVDAHGLPQDVQQTKKLGYGLDQNAIAAIMQYRFKPAIKNGQPVSVKINIEVSFRIGVN